MKKLFGLGVLLGIAAIFIAYSIHNSKKENLKSQIYSKINKVLDNKSVVIDGRISLTEGELKDTGYEPSDDTNSSSLFSVWWESEELYTIYEATSGGFTVKELTRLSDESYQIETHISGDMGYKKPSRVYVEPNYTNISGTRYKISDGYWTDTYRQSVADSYRSAFSFFTEDDKYSPGAYTPGKYIDISNFPQLSNEFFQIENIEPRIYSSTSINAKEWETSGDHGAYIGNESRIVYYNTYGKHYELTEKQDEINKDLITKSSVSLGLVIVLLATLYLVYPNPFRS